MEYINYIIQTLASNLLDLLPKSPFKGIIDSLGATLSPHMGYLNYFIPVGSLLRIFSLWLAAVAMFYAYSVIMRWVKLIGD